MLLDGLILPGIVAPLKHVGRLVTERKYRDYCFMASRMGSLPRRQPGVVRVMGRELAIPDAASFLSAYREIFVEESYRFNFPGPAPRILDLGANIGLSVLYFKHLYPDAEIRAYEADPAIFDYLKRNCDVFGCTGVELVQGAVWHEDGILDFNADGADGGRVSRSDAHEIIKIPSYDIKTILKSASFDVLKIDIEGAEQLVVPACRGLLKNVRYLFLEYHSEPGSRQQLHTILEILAESGFRYYLESVHQTPSPLVLLPVYEGFDMQLNIVAWRDESC